MSVTLYPLLAAILFATNSVLPQIGIVLSVFSPLILLLYFDHPKRVVQTDGLLLIVIVALGILNYMLAAYFVISPLFAAVFIRYCVKKRLHTAWLPVTGAAVLSFVITFAVIYGIPSYRESLVQFTAKALKTFMDAAREANAPMVQSPYFTEIEKTRTQTALMLVLMFPAFNYIYTAFSAYVSRRLFQRIKRLPSETFRIPDVLVWVLILSFALIFTPVLYGRFTGINLAGALLVLYAFQGFEIVLWWMNRIRIIPLLKMIIFIFIFSEPPIILFISLVGLFSVWFNFYGKNKSEEQEKSE